MGKKRRKGVTRSRLYIDAVAVRAALYCKHISMDELQRLSGFAPEVCETIYYGGKVSLSVVEYLADFFKCPANDLLMPSGRAAIMQKEIYCDVPEPPPEKELEIRYGGSYDPYKNAPAPADDSPAHCVTHTRRIFHCEGFSSDEVREMLKIF